jgi:hypothetical protein
MKVSEFSALLDKFPPDMEVIVGRYSDYTSITLHEILCVLPQEDYYIKYHRTMDKAKTDKLITVLWLG